MLKKQIVLLVISFFFLSSTFAQKNSDSLIIFIGKKIDVRPLDFQATNQIVLTKIIGKDTLRRNATQTNLDSKYTAKYQILKLLNGYYKADTIEFVVWDHYGTPAFSKFEHVLLFVYPNKMGLIHEKYQYFDIYLTQNNRWASPYAYNDYNGPFKKDITIKPEKIKFNANVSFNLKERYAFPSPMHFVEPYYEIGDEIATPIYGNYIEDLIEIKKQGALKANGYYK